MGGTLNLVVADGWYGSRVRRERARLGAQLPAPCQRCGGIVDVDDDWHVGHILDGALGGGNDAANLGIEHAACNTAAGGRLAHSLRRAAAPAKKRIRPW